MGVFKVHYLIEKRVGGKIYRYWQPKKHYRINGASRKCPFPAEKLPDNAQAAFVRALELNKRLHAWRKGFDEIPASEGTLSWLIGEFRKDMRFRDMERSTQKYYQYNFKPLQNEMGDVPLDKLTRKLAREFCLSFPGTTRKASMLAAVGRALFNFGKDIEAVTQNPFEALRISKPRARANVWTMDAIAEVQAKAIEMGLSSIALAAQLGLDTGQRPGDLRALSWNNYTGGTIKLRQNKTCVWIEVPVLPELKGMLDAAGRSSPLVLMCERFNKPYTKETLCHIFREVCDAAGIEQALQFRDLRRTAVVRLAEHGCTNSEIAGVTGHALKNVESILEVYLPRNSKMAKNAIEKLRKVGKIE